MKTFPRISLLTNIPEVKVLKNYCLHHQQLLTTLVPSKKGISFVKMSRNNKDYSLNKDHKLTYSQKFHSNQVGIIVRNNKMYGFAWADADKVKLIGKQLRITHTNENLDKDLLASRYFIFNLILGLFGTWRPIRCALHHRQISASLEFNQYVVFSNADAQIESHPYLPVC